jgi:hypothetical protein
MHVVLTILSAAKADMKFCVTVAALLTGLLSKTCKGISNNIRCTHDKNQETIQLVQE